MSYSAKDQQMQELDKQIYLLQQSTRTAWKAFIPLHNLLRQKSRLYYQWHVLPIAKVVHATVLVFYILGVSFGILVFNTQKVSAAAITWDGGGSTNNWSEAANWSGDVVPGSGDAVTFNGTSTKDAIVDASFGGTLTSLTIASGYTGTITMARSLTTSSTFTQAAGTFTAADQTLTITSTFTLSAGIFTASSGTTALNGSVTISGSPTFNHNSGTVNLGGVSGTWSCNNVTFNFVTFSNTGGKTIGSNCTFPVGSNPSIPFGFVLNGTLSGSGTLTSTNNTLTLGVGGILSGFTGIVSNSNFTVSGGTADFGNYTTVDLNSAFTVSSGSFKAPSTGSFTVGAALTFSGTGTFDANGGTLTFDGASGGTLSCNSATFNAVVFNNTGAKTVSTGCTFPIGTNPTIGPVTMNGGLLTGSGTITSPGGTLTLTSGSLFSGFTGLVVSTFVINGAAVDFSNYTTVDINSTFTMSSGSLKAPSGTMTAAGALTFSGGTFDANGGTVAFDGTSSVALSCNNVTFNLVTFAHTAGTKTVSSNCTMPMGNNPNTGFLLAVAGTLSGTGTLTNTASSGGIVLNSGATLSGFNGLAVAGNFTVSGATVDLGSYTTVDFNGAFTFSSGTFTAPSTTMTLASTFTVSGSSVFNANGGTVNFDGTGATLNCNNITFHLVTFVNQVGTKSVTSSCSLPLGTDPVIPTGLTLAGTLSGTGTLSFSAGTQTFNSGAALSGFSGLVANGIVASGATLDFSNYNPLTINTILTLSAGTFTAPSGTMSIGGNYTHTAGGTFNHNNGTVVINNTATIDVATTETFYNLTFDSSGLNRAVASNDTLIVLGTLNLNFARLNQTTIPAAGTIAVKGNIIQGSGSAEGGTGKIVIDGTGDQTFTGNATLSAGGLPTIEINKASGTLAYQGTIRATTNWTYIAGNIDTTTHDSTIAFKPTASITISGSQSFDNLIFDGTATQSGLVRGATFTIPSDNTVTVNGTLGLVNGYIDGGTIDAQGSIDHTNTFDGGTGLITIGGPAARTINLVSGLIPALSLTSSNTTVNGPDSGTTEITGNYTQSAGNFVGKVGNLHVNGNFSLSGGSFTAPSGRLGVDGAYSVTGGNFIPNNGTTSLNAASNQTYSLPSSSNLTLTDGSLIGYWPLDETVSGSTVIDASGHDKDGAPNGASGINNLPQPSSDVAPTQFTNSRSLDFDGTDDAIDLGNSPSYKPSAVSMSLWFKTSASCLTSECNMLRYLFNGYQLGLNSANKLTAYVFTAAGSKTEVASPNAVNDGQWHHVVGTYSGSGTDGLKLYLDGTLIGSATGAMGYAEGGLGLGRAGKFALNFYTGKLDDVRLYNRVLSSDEVSQLAAGNELSSPISTVTLGADTVVNGNLELNRTALDLSTNNYSLSVTGNWNNTSGTFIARNGTVNLTGTNQAIFGSNTFYNLNKVSSGTLTFEANKTQTFDGTLHLEGSAGSLLNLRSSNSGAQWNIDPRGARTLGYLDVQDSKNINSTTIDAGTGSINSGNNTSWNFPVKTTDTSEKTDTTTFTLTKIGNTKLTKHPTRFTYIGKLLKPSFSGTGVANSTVKITADGQEICKTTVSDKGEWFCQVQILKADEYTIRISLTTKEGETTELPAFTLITVFVDGTDSATDPVSASVTDGNSEYAVDSEPTPAKPGSGYVTSLKRSADGKTILAEFRVIVKYKDGKPLANKPVTLHSDPQTVETDKDGIAKFHDVPLGEHELVYVTENKTTIKIPLTLKLLDSFVSKVQAGDAVSVELHPVEIILPIGKADLLWLLWPFLSVIGVLLAGYIYLHINHHMTVSQTISPELLDVETIRIQQSTRTTSQAFAKSHNWLRMHSPAYYWWHTLPIQRYVLGALLGIYIILTFVFVIRHM